MSRQWIVVLLIVAGLALGAAALSRYGAGIDRVEVGSKMPDFMVSDPHTRDSVSLKARYHGSVTLVNIWATWCVPCRTEMPAMEEVYQAYKDRGFRIAAVSIDEAADDVVNQFTEELGVTFDILHDRSTAIQKVYQTTGVPESFLVNSEGIIVRRVIGAHDWNSELNRSLIERLLAEAKPSSGVAAR
jgi:cytochrome c biogenesis protein CcmG/thiol:disulfide interchange protein DsbE